MPKQPNTVCALCNKPIYKKPSDMKQCKSGLFFCCRKNKDEAQRIGGLEAIQPIHYGTGQRVYRSIAFNSFEAKCNRCGYNRHQEILQVHHKDRNRTNNDKDNLEILCPTCHTEEHFVTKTAQWSS